MTSELINTLAALPEDGAWAIARQLETTPGCSLLGALKVTPDMIEKLVALRERLESSAFWLAQVAAAPACPLSEGEKNDVAFI